MWQPIKLIYRAVQRHLGAKNNKTQNSNWKVVLNPALPRKTIDGGFTTQTGTVWRRKVEGKWEYREDAETLEQFLDRQY